MGVYADQGLPRITDFILRGTPIERLRQRAAEGLDGKVLAIGFGSGRNVPHYPGSVTRVRAVDPATVGRKLAARQVASSPCHSTTWDPTAKRRPSTTRPSTTC